MDNNKNEKRWTAIGQTMRHTKNKQTNKRTDKQHEKTIQAVIIQKKLNTF